MQSKTTRAFRTISEAGEELDLQPHVLRFWESKFPQIKPMKRGGGRRFYRPEDIEFLRGIKILLHDEKHPIKDVQKLIRVKGAARVLELGRSVERAATPKAVEETVLIPERIVQSEPDIAPPPRPAKTAPPNVDIDDTVPRPIGGAIEPRPIADRPVATSPPVLELVEEIPEEQSEDDAERISNADIVSPPPQPAMSAEDKAELETALERLQKLRARWSDFQSSRAE